MARFGFFVPNTGLVFVYCRSQCNVQARGLGMRRQSHEGL